VRIVSCATAILRYSEGSASFGKAARFAVSGQILRGAQDRGFSDVVERWLALRAAISQPPPNRYYC